MKNVTLTISFVLTSALVIFIIVILSPKGEESHSGNPVNAHIISYDILVHPKEKVYLKAKLRKGFFSIKPEIAGERLEFFVGKESKGIALTGGDGVAVREIAPQKTGIYFFTVRLPEYPRASPYRAEDSQGLIACWETSKPIIIVKLEDTLYEVDKPRPFSMKEPQMKPIRGAKEALRSLSKRFNIIYITRRDELSLNRLREWLSDKRFPPAPIFTLGLKEESPDESRYLGEKIDEFKEEGWKTIRIGIGGGAEDAEAFLEAGMRAIIIADRYTDLPEGAERVEKWEDVKKLLK